MTSRWRMPVFLALSLLAGLAAPAPVSRAAAPRIVAIGDVHGAIDQFVQILQAAGLVDGRRRWSGGNARLVQTGDYFDRGAGVREVLDLMMRLEEEAKRAGGRVDVLFGNHEGMNLLHEFRDVSQEAYRAFVDGRSEERRNRAFEAHAKIAARAGAPLQRDEWMQAHPPGFVEYAEALGPAGKYGRWLRSRKVVTRIDDTIFMHAGISPELQVSLDDVNRTAADEIRAFDTAVSMMERAGVVRPFFTLREIATAARLELQRIVSAQKTNEELPSYVTREFAEAIDRVARVDTWSLLAPEGPLWFRGYATWGPQALPQAQQLLIRFDAARFVVGHTPQPGRIASRFNGRVFLIDTGMLSTHYKGGRPSALELQDGQVTAIYGDGREAIGSLTGGAKRP